MTHGQKLDFVFQRNGRAHLNRRGRGGGSVQWTTSDIIQTASLCSTEAIAISKAGAPNSNHSLVKRIIK